MAAKQVLIMLKMPNGQRTGKYCAQAAHASMGALFSIGNIVDNKMVIPLDNEFVRRTVRKFGCNNAILLVGCDRRS